MPGVASKERTISYLRATWPQGSPAQATLQGALTGALNQLDPGGTTLPLRDGYGQVRHWRISGQALQMHIAAWTARAPASTVPHGGKSEADLAEEPPGENWDYLDGDGMILIRRDHCLLMPSGLHPKTMERYLKNLLTHAVSEHSDIHPRPDAFRLVPIGKSELINGLYEQGLKSIRLNIGQYLETARAGGLQSETLVRKLGRVTLETLFSRDEDRTKVAEAENVHAHLIIRIDTRRSGLTVQELSPVGQQLVDESYEDVEFETRNGQRVKRGDMVFRKRVKVQAFAKTVHHNHAWELMSDYLAELEEIGALEE